MKVNKIINIAELFCGAGGFAQGSKEAGFNHLWGLDNHEDSCKSFEKNQKCKSYCEDIREFTKPSYLKQIKKTHGNINGLLFGFPCNDFSLVGKNKKMEGKFGGLYKYACKVLDYFEPEFFVAENVTSLGKKLKHNSSVRKKVKDIFNNEKLQNQNYQNFKKIMGDLASCSKSGYRIYADNYKFEEYGVPQTRHRIILVGFREDFFKENKINFEKPKKIEGPFVTCKQAIDKIPEWASHQELTKHDDKVIRRLKKTAEGKNVWDLDNDEDGLPGVKKARMSHIYKRLDSSKPSYTVTGSGGGGTHVYHYKENRALTNRERARLQTFPDTYNFIGGKESIRRQIGMAVPVLGAKKIMNAVKKALKKNKQYKSYHHDWMIKGKTRDLYFTGKEYVGYQMKFDFDD
ncbi:DNA cytosine methyltransferase [Candidatus Pelagibacter sp. HIMB1593]|uniref:DNA cytosine methyltransferase n=1 Tax=Candidatus Pelagibacter sp. HIMB1593 TaxID=3413355 RepID=UPI003F82D899